MQERAPTEADAERTKRVRQAPSANNEGHSAHAAPWNPPSMSSMYANGLACRAEAVNTSSGTWSVDGSQWRGANLTAADPTNEVLKQRQADVRRMLLKK